MEKCVPSSTRDWTRDMGKPLINQEGHVCIVLLMIDGRVSVFPFLPSGLLEELGLLIRVMKHQILTSTHCLLYLHFNFAGNESKVGSFCLNFATRTASFPSIWRFILLLFFVSVSKKKKDRLSKPAPPKV